MKRFLVFSGYNFYPSGGMSDFVGSCDTLEAAKQLAQSQEPDWADIVDHNNNNRWHMVIRDGQLDWEEGPY